MFPRLLVKCCMYTHHMVSSCLFCDLFVCLFLVFEFRRKLRFFSGYRYLREISGMAFNICVYYISIIFKRAPFCVFLLPLVGQVTTTQNN